MRICFLFKMEFIYLHEKSKNTHYFIMRILTVIFLLLFNTLALAQSKSYSTSEITSDLKYFTDWSAMELNKEVKSKNLKEFKSPLMRDIATQLLNDTYDKTFRAAKYEAYPSNKSLSKTLKLNSGFSRYENMTGIYLEKGEAVVLVGDLHGRRVSLLIPDWMRQPTPGFKPTEDPNGWGLKKQEHRLSEGVNVIYVEQAGNVYVNYFEDEIENAPEIAIHFPTGLINGYFDASIHSNSDWDKLLANAVSPMMDARGKHVQVAYPVEWFKFYTAGKGIELLSNYDKMLNLQYELMGAIKYNRVPKNRVLARVNFNYYMFRDQDGVAYLGDKGTMRMVADPDVVIKGDPCWGFSHEVGHVMQMSPQLTWAGMTEVSNNIFAMYTTTALGNESRLKAQNSYAAARKTIIESSPKISYLKAGDPFQSLVPFWQLHLYFTKNGFPDFYADVMEQMRNQPHSGIKNESINNMFDFIKVSSDITKTDLTDFFDQWGFFYVGKLSIDDYGKYELLITQEMVDETKEYIASKNYPKPTSDITLTVE